MNTGGCYKLAPTRSRTTVYDKSCTNTFHYYRTIQNLQKHVAVLPYTTKFAQTRSRTPVYNLNKHVPILAYTTKLAQTRSNTTVYHKHVPVLPYIAKLVETRSRPTKVAQALSSTTARYQSCKNTFQYYRIPQTLHKHEVLQLPLATCAQQNTRGVAAFPIDTATCAQQNKRRGAVSPMDTESTRKRHAKRRENDAPTNWRRTRVQPPNPQTINGNPSLRIREKYP